MRPLRKPCVNLRLRIDACVRVCVFGQMGASRLTWVFPHATARALAEVEAALVGGFGGGGGGESGSDGHRTAATLPSSSPAKARHVVLCMALVAAIAAVVCAVHASAERIVANLSFTALLFLNCRAVWLATFCGAEDEMPPTTTWVVVGEESELETTGDALSELAPELPCASEALVVRDQQRERACGSCFAYYSAVFLPAHAAAAVRAAFPRRHSQLSEDLHVTLQYKPSDEAVSRLLPHVAMVCEIRLLEEVYDDSGQCLRVELPASLADLCANVHAHITLSTAAGVPAVYSNELLQRHMLQPPELHHGPRSAPAAPLASLPLVAIEGVVGVMVKMKPLAGAALPAHVREQASKEAAAKAAAAAGAERTEVWTGRADELSRLLQLPPTATAPLMTTALAAAPLTAALLTTTALAAAPLAAAPPRTPPTGLPATPPVRAATAAAAATTAERTTPPFAPPGRRRCSRSLLSAFLIGLAAFYAIGTPVLGLVDVGGPIMFS